MAEIVTRIRLLSGRDFGGKAMPNADQDNYDAATKIVRQCLGEHVACSHRLIGDIRQALNSKDERILELEAALAHAIDNEDRERTEHDELRAGLIAENGRLRAALEICAGACYQDDHALEYRPTREALIARSALG